MLFSFDHVVPSAAYIVHPAEKLNDSMRACMWPRATYEHPRWAEYPHFITALSFAVFAGLFAGLLCVLVLCAGLFRGYAGLLLR